jgi:hypothetical protein
MCVQGRHLMTNKNMLDPTREIHRAYHNRFHFSV